MNNDFILQSVAILQKAINYQFKNIALLEEALSHPSLKQEDRGRLGYQESQASSRLHSQGFLRHSAPLRHSRESGNPWIPDQVRDDAKVARDHAKVARDDAKAQVKNYERLELLGDSILGFLITEILFHKFQNYNEGNLAKIKSHLVSKEIISKVASNLNLADYIIMTKGEELSGGRDNLNNLENTMEAIIAAIYLDSDIQSVQKVVEDLWTFHIDNINLDAIDPKTHLQEWSQEHHYGIPLYEVMDKTGPVHAPIFTVMVSVADKFTASGSGKSIKLAEKDAAKKLLDEVGK